MALTAISPPLSKAAQVATFDRSATGQRRFYRPELDVLRFFAFLSVFLHHGLPGIDPSHYSGKLATVAKAFVIAKQAGSFGVCLFFALSAYLITELLLREQQGTGAIHVRFFYVRRMLRIWPLYFTFLAAGVVLGWAVPAYRIGAGRLLAFLLLSGNWYAATAGCGANPIAPLWSISVEEQFYLIWPSIAKLGRATLWRVSWCILFLSCCATIWTSHTRMNASRAIWANSIVQFQFFAVGALLALALSGRAPRFRKWQRVGLIFSGLLSWLVAQAVFRVKDDAASSSFMLPWGYVCIAAGCVLLLLGFLGIAQAIPKPLIYLGKISYGLYVFHLLCLDLAWKLGMHGIARLGEVGSSLAAVRLVLIEITAMALTIGFASLSYRYLERPCLSAKERFTFVRSRAA